MSDIPKINTPQHGGGRDTKGCFVNVEGLTGPESDTLRASLLTGYCWVRGRPDGRLERVPSFEPLPSPVPDARMLPYWRLPTADETRQADLFGFDLAGEAALRHASPSIHIASLCGYGYTPEKYQHEADKLTAWGFICMRSPRDPDGGYYWEQWFLSGVLMVKGSLKEALDLSEAKNNEEKLSFVLEFLRRNVRFGTLDVSVQRMAQVMD